MRFESEIKMAGTGQIRKISSLPFNTNHSHAMNPEAKSLKTTDGPTLETSTVQLLDRNPGSVDATAGGAARADARGVLPRAGRAERIREVVMTCNLRESLINICLHGGVCWKAAFRRGLRCLCQPFFHGKHCELFGEQQVQNFRKVERPPGEESEIARNESRSTSAAARSGSTLKIFMERRCSALESKYVDCRNTEECIVILMNSNHFKYSCRCLSSFHCHTTPTRSVLRDGSAFSLSGLAGVSLVALNLLAILLVLAYVATVRKSNAARKISSWKRRWKARCRRDGRTFGRGLLQNTNLRDNAAVAPKIRRGDLLFSNGDSVVRASEAPKIIFYKAPPGHLRSHVDEHLRTHAGLEQRSPEGDSDSGRNVTRFHGSRSSEAGHVTDVIFEEID